MSKQTISDFEEERLLDDEPPSYEPQTNWQINWENLVSYLDHDTPPQKLDPLPRGFRLIDVETKSVLRIRAPLDYTCLSYVWGGVQDFQATTKNINALAKPGSLDDPKLPATIQDAIIACRKLGQKYLWVDRLCILQDDPDGTKQIHIDEMGRIYNHAFVTLVAHEGKDAEYGLHGVSDRLKLRPVLKRRGLGAPGLWISLFWDSKWASRGWTYQEAALSHRLICFTAGDATFHSSQGGCEMSNSSSRNFQLFIGQHLFPSTNYRKAVQVYTARELGIQEDALNAFAGVSRHLFGKNHRFGIPTIGFDNAIHWMPVGYPRERRSMFPSWSWVSVKGESIVAYGPVISIAFWAFVDADQRGKITLTWPAPEAYSFKEKRVRVLSERIKWESYERYWEMRAAVKTCKHGCMLTTPPGMADMDLNSSTFEEDFTARWPSHTSLWEACRGISTTQKQPQYISLFSEHQKRLASKEGRVLVVSQTAILSVQCMDEHDNWRCHGQPRSYYKIRNGEKLVGVGSFDDPDCKEEILTNIKFLALTFSFEKRSIPDGVVFPDNLFRDFMELWRQEDGPASLRAIAIKATEEDGVHRRIGSGFISFHKWVELKPEHHAFVLK